MEWTRISFRKAEETSAMKTEKVTVVGHSACEFIANSREMECCENMGTARDEVIPLSFGILMSHQSVLGLNLAVPKYEAGSEPYRVPKLSFSRNTFFVQHQYYDKVSGYENAGMQLFMWPQMKLFLQLPGLKESYVPL
ncbi:hypothetical protein llap_2127 [Limosa lapponica baueri]|uniref:Uncharacterized protein n=1 Tax=Limosa lapponica baueri TaxID=1758121 RepID=A0A2I0UNH9_LIMLA|nr:hypothetical protein llap_2127 [Limosa lapponica baueri]